VRDNTILPKVGTNTYNLDQQSIEALPQGSNAQLDKVLLQTPGVTQDSAASGLLHVRNEHANVQYRINGVLLPDGVAGFGQVLDSAIVGNMALIDGALPAQYGMHTAALVDITTKNNVFDNSGVAGFYGGSHQTINPSVQYGGTSGNTQYFFLGRFFSSGEGIENPTASYEPIHDDTLQGRYFGYTSTQLDDNARLSTITGAFVGRFQIPNRPDQTPSFTPFNFDSSQINENQLEQNYFGVVAWQKSAGDIDTQLSYFSRYSTLHFIPDPFGDLAFNGVASDVFRSSYVNGIQSDTAYRWSETHTLRAGFTASGEQSQVYNSSLVYPGGFDPVAGANFQTSSVPELVTEGSNKFGWLIGLYAQDEWKITDKITLNVGLRFDQMYQYLDANQVSPRAGLQYKPWDVTTFHIGYARNFTPPEQVIAAPTNLAVFQGTSAQPEVQAQSPVLPERSHVFDTGVVQKVMPGLEVGVDAYYKLAKDLLDDGQFGQALVLSGFNYAKAYNAGLETKVTYQSGNLKAYANLAWARQRATDIVSNQYLFPLDELKYIANNYIYTDHAQLLTGSGGVSYLWQGTKFSADLVYGSGLRNGFANTGTVNVYTPINLGVSHEFQNPNGKPLTVRFDIVNILDQVYFLRDGTGIGVFAPQYGARRGFFAGVSQKF